MGTGPVTAPLAIWGVEGKLPLLLMYSVRLIDSYVEAEGITALYDIAHGAELTVVQKGRQIAPYVFVWETVPNTPTILVPELKKANYLILKEPARFLIKELN